MSQIDTRRDAIEFLSGEWALKPNAAYSQAELENYRTVDLISLAREWEEDAKR